MLPKAWRNNKNMYALVCIDIFTKKADIEPMKDKESNTCNKAMENIFDRLGIPETIYSDEGQNLQTINLFSSQRNIRQKYNHAPFVESLNRTMKRMMDRYMEANDVSSWITIYRYLLNAYNNTKTGFAPNDIKKEDIDTL